MHDVCTLGLHSGKKVYDDVDGLLVFVVLKPLGIESIQWKDQATSSNNHKGG